MENIALKSYKKTNGACVKVDTKHVERESILQENEHHSLFMARIEDSNREDGLQVPEQYQRFKETCN